MRPEDPSSRPSDPGPEITRILNQVGAGDPSAGARLLPVVYDELRRLARQRMSKLPPGNTLQPTALVHEAYLRLLGPEGANWSHRGHFFAAAARSMRNILVDQARRKSALRHGGDQRQVDLEGVDLPFEETGVDLLALEGALRDLEAQDPRKARVVELRFFAGLTAEETARALSISLPTAERDWRFARAYLFRLMSEEE
ncbi:MAG: sigma-70 family RNA polymerase sigma factor [Candidatus Eisenbacteria bacterium]